MSTAQIAPLKNRLIGITHSREGVKIIREPKVLKVGIGLPRGKAADVFVDPDGKWNIRMGKKGADGKIKWETVAKLDTREEAESAFRKAWKLADVVNYPRKIAYFQFTRPVMGEDGSEIYVPDFQAIETHSFPQNGRVGTPTEIDVVFLDDEPFSGSYAMWSASELRCQGDGVTALRSVAMYDDEKKVPEDLREAWKAAKLAGERTFPIVEGCWTCNCPFSKEQSGKPSPCKPSGDLKFQLSRNIRVGGTAFFHTSGYRSIVQIFSAVERIKELTGGRIAGIPLKMVLRSHVTNHNGQKAVQQNVSLEFRTEDMDSLRKNLIEQAWKFRAAAGLPAPTRMIESGPADAEVFGDDSPMTAEAMANEFYTDTEDATDEPVTTNAPVAASASQATTEKLAEKLKTVKTVVATPAFTATDNPPPPSTWPDRAAMNAAFLEIKKVIPEADYKRIMAGTMMGSLKHDDPKAAEMYTAMVGVRDGGAPAKTEPGLFGEVKDEDIF